MNQDLEKKKEPAMLRAKGQPVKAGATTHAKTGAKKQSRKKKPQTACQALENKKEIHVDGSQHEAGCGKR